MCQNAGPLHLDKSTGLFSGGCMPAGGGQCSSGCAGRAPGGMSSWGLDPHTHILQRTRAVGHGDGGAVAGRSTLKTLKPFKLRDSVKS